MISRELQQGKAAEHLVVADLLLSGYSAFLADAGSPFDVVVSLKGQLSTIQVRSTRQSRTTKRGVTPAYRFGLRRGKHGHLVSGEGINLYAFVALDIRSIAYIPTSQLTHNGKLHQIVELRPPGVAATRRYSTGKIRTYDYRVITEFPFERVI